jgi:hypothetical protein
VATNQEEVNVQQGVPEGPEISEYSQNVAHRKLHASDHPRLTSRVEGDSWLWKILVPPGECFVSEADVSNARSVWQVSAGLAAV